MITEVSDGALCNTNGTSTLTLTGSSFGPLSVSTPIVRLNGEVVATANVAFVTAHSKLSFLCPEGEGTGHSLTIEVEGQESTSYAISYKVPTLTSVLPTTLKTTPGIDELMITGSDFGSDVNAMGVSVGGQSCAITHSSHTQINCTSPGGMGSSQAIVALVSGQQSNAKYIDFIGPAVSSVEVEDTAPTRGTKVITVHGSNFGASGNVLVDENECTSPTWSNSRIICTLPEGQGNVYVKVSSGSAISVPHAFSYDPPNVTSVIGNADNDFGTGGNIITVQGTNFGTSLTVTVGGLVCSNAGPVSGHTEIQCYLPIGQGTNLDLVVDVSGRTNSPVWSFDYDAPEITSVSRSTLETGGSEEIVISGHNFGTVASVSISPPGAVCTIKAGFHDHGTLTCFSPAGHGTGLSLAVEVSGQSATTAVQYIAPVIATKSISSSPTEGGVSLALTGTNFGTVGRVTIGGVECSLSGAQYNDDLVECTTPEGVGSDAQIMLRTGSADDGHEQSDTIAFGYDPPSITSITSSTAGTFASAGNRITINGTNFGNDASQVSVKIGVALRPCLCLVLID